MPLYGYDCNKCGHQFQSLVRSSDVPSCPTCESTDLTRQLSLIAAPSKGGNEAPASPRCEVAGGCSNCPNALH
jgi:putative FmdB family regulatory protein